MPTTEAVPVYSRISQNRRRSVVLAALAVALLIPSVAGAGYLCAHGLVLAVNVVGAEKYLLRQLSEGQTDDQRLVVSFVPTLKWMAAMLVSENLSLEVARREAAQHRTILAITPVTTVGVAAVLGLFFWAIAASSTTKLLALCGCRPPRPDEAEAQRLLENLALGAGLPPPKLYIIDSSLPNAFAIGWSPRHAAIGVTTGTLRLFDHRELEGVLAHELSHIGNRDTSVNMMVAAIALFLRYPLLALGTLFIGPALAVLFRAAVSQKREFLADADAALLTRYPEGLMRALAKTGGAGSSVTGPMAAFAHFFFADPAQPAQGGFRAGILATHPPLSERIQRLMEYHGPSSAAVLVDAVEQGKKYAREHPLGELDAIQDGPPVNELSMAAEGNVMGCVYRVLGSRSVRVHKEPDRYSEVMARIQPGQLVVAFDDLGPLRQVETQDEIFGYIPRDVPLVAIPDTIPAEVYNPATRRAMEAKLPPLSSYKEARTRRWRRVPEIALALVFAMSALALAWLLLAKPS